MHIIAQLRCFVIERGWCGELLLDNSIGVRSGMVVQFADKWRFAFQVQATYTPCGNGIVERNRQTFKRIAEWGGITPEEATFWYNVMPQKGTEDSSVPSNVLVWYHWRVPFDVNLCTEDEDVKSSFSVGDKVWSKPPPSCTKQWMPGKVTRIVSKHTVCVDGMPRHVRDIRKQCSGVGRGSHGHLQADDLRESYRASWSPIFPCGDMEETGFLEQANDVKAPELPPGEDEVPEDSSQGPTQGENDEVQVELEAEQSAEELMKLRRSQHVRQQPRYVDQYEY